PMPIPDGYQFRAFGDEAIGHERPTTENPVAELEDSAELVLFEKGRKGRRIGTIKGTTQGACEFGMPVPDSSTADPDDGFTADRTAMRRRFEARHPDRKVLAFEVLFSGCNRGAARRFVAVVVEAKNRDKEALVYDESSVAEDLAPEIATPVIRRVL